MPSLEMFRSRTLVLGCILSKYRSRSISRPTTKIGCLEKICCWNTDDVRWASTANHQSKQNRHAIQKTHYEILHIKRTASSEEIRSAFLRLSKQYHPDINNKPDNHKQFVLINEAYSVLSKPLSRRDYDLTLQAHKYFRQQQNYSAYRSHGYGYSGNSGHYYYHRSYEDGFSSRHSQGQEFNSGKRLHNALINFYTITAVVTIALVAFILQSMYIFYPDIPHKNFIQEKDISGIDNHELIMTSEHDGRTVFYYAIPNEKTPSKFEILAVAKKENDQDSDELEQLNNVSQCLLK